jgi:signal transduction histidine kinase/ActR/RegA family two-component response regulator
MIDRLVDSSALQPFMPHGMCLLWQTDMLLLHVVSDGLIALSYYSIPLAIIYFVLKRRDLKLRWLLGLFGIFILACGTTHLMEIWTIWHPDYYAEGYIKLFTALVSAGTAISLWPLLPQMLRIPCPSSLEEANLKLWREVELRQAQERKVSRLNSDLEYMVSARTLQLTRANQRLEQEALERRAMEAELRERDHRKNEFLAMLGHELRNPLASIASAAAVLGMLDLEHPQLRWAHEIIERQVGHLTRMVDDLLDVSRLVNGKVSLNKSPVDLVKLLGQVVEGMDPQFEASRHRVKLDCLDQPIMVDCDPVRLSQVFANLLDNAAKYSPENTDIEVSARIGDGQAVIEVLDHGHGISQNLLPRVFNLFEQGDRSLDRPQGGLGIGLTIVKRLVEIHGGQVTANNAGAGLGSVFTVSLPIAGMDIGQTDPVAASVASPVGKLRILVIDDDSDVRTSTAILLQMKGYEVWTAESGVEAYPVIAAVQPQVVLLDIGLPGENGYQVAGRIRALPAGRGLLLVALSGYGPETSVANSRNAGFDHHLLKPLRLDALRNILAEHEAKLG